MGAPIEIHSLEIVSRVTPALPHRQVPQFPLEFVEQGELQFAPIIMESNPFLELRLLSAREESHNFNGTDCQG